MISRITSSIFFLFCICSVGFASSGEELALTRLSVTTDMLVSIGEEMACSPIAGMLVMEDTVSVDFTMSPDYTYQFIMWTESTFNFVDFWMNDSSGEARRSDLGDHTTFSVIPRSGEPEVWQLQMELLDGASADTAYYAVVALRRERDSLI